MMGNELRETTECPDFSHDPDSVAFTSAETQQSLDGRLRVAVT